MSTPPEAMPRHQLERKLRRSRTLNLVMAVVAVAGLLFGGLQWYEANTVAQPAAPGDPAAQGAAGEGEAAGTGSEPGAAAAAAHVRLKQGDPMALGSVDAPVVLSEWIDFRCPFCAVFSRDVFPVLVKEYVDTGKVRIEVNDVAFFGAESARAAVAARAAGEQGKYFEFVHAVYEAAPESGHPELPPAELLELAKVAGVPDLERFQADTQREDLATAVQRSTEQAHQLKVTGVPFFAVGDQGISGAQSVATFRQFLDQQLAQSSP